MPTTSKRAPTLGTNQKQVPRNFQNYGHDLKSFKNSIYIYQKNLIWLVCMTAEGTLGRTSGNVTVMYFIFQAKRWTSLYIIHNKKASKILLHLPEKFDLVD